MARKRRHGGRRGFRVGKYINLGFKLLGAGVALNPAIRGATEAGSEFKNIPRNVALHYTGFDINNPGGGINMPELTGGIASIIGGIALVQVGHFLARRF